jgi:hypothetical protein
MTKRLPVVQLTWAGFEAAVDVIAASCCRRDRSGVHAATPAGMVLAVALAERLGLNVLQQATPGMLLVDCYNTPELRRASEAHEDVEPWVWADGSPSHRWNSAVKIQGPAALVLPWQDAGASCRRPFLAGFDD